MTEPATEEDLLVLHGTPNVSWPADHPRWPVACGVCLNRCSGSHVTWNNFTTNRAVAVVIYVCARCNRWGLVDSPFLEAAGAEKWLTRVFVASHADTNLFLFPSQMSNQLGAFLDSDPEEAT